jgi:hypothetical protein
MNYPYDFKGNLHAHSNNGGGGTESPATVGAWYRNNGYYFYTITDHDKVTPDPGVSGIVWLGGAEEDSYDGGSGHMNHIGIASPVGTGNDQARVDAVIAAGGFTVLNHPARADYAGWTAGEIEALNGVVALEVFNGGGDMNSSAIWDTVLTSGKLIWGESSDDSHSAPQHGDGYIVVNSSSASPTAGDLTTQIKAGNFYASRGADMNISTSGSTISVLTTLGSYIRWIKQSGTVIKTAPAPFDMYVPFGDEGYVRIEILDAGGSPVAWSQPITIPYSVTHTNGTLVKEAGAPCVYILKNGLIGSISNSTAFDTHKLRWDRIVTISQAELAGYGSGVGLDEPALGLVVKGSWDGVYVVDGAPGAWFKRPIASADAFLAHGFRWSDIVQLSDNRLPGLNGAPIYENTATPNGLAVKCPGSAAVYLLEDSARRPFTSAAAFTSRGFGWDRIITISESDLMNNYRDGEPVYINSGAIVKGTGAVCYVVDSDGATPYRRPISSAARLTEAGFHWEDILTIGDAELSGYTDSDAI